VSGRQGPFNPADDAIADEDDQGDQENWDAWEQAPINQLGEPDNLEEQAQEKNVIDLNLAPMEQGNVRCSRKSSSTK
jgi:hypothetical protein